MTCNLSGVFLTLFLRIHFSFSHFLVQLYVFLPYLHDACELGMNKTIAKVY